MKCEKFEGEGRKMLARHPARKEGASKNEHNPPTASLRKEPHYSIKKITGLNLSLIEDRNENRQRRLKLPAESGHEIGGHTHSSQTEARHKNACFMPVVILCNSRERIEL